MNDPRTEPMIPVEVSIKHRRPIFDIRAEMGIRPYAPPVATSIVIRGWERKSGQVVQYEGTLTNLVLRQEPPTSDDLEWLRNIGAIPASDESAPIPFYGKDRETLREAGRLLDQLDAALGSDDVSAISNLLASSRLTYLGGYLAGLADREPRE